MRVDFDQIIANVRDGAYKSIGSGSGRRVFDLENGYVVKVAKNKKGIAQNEAEYQISSASNSALFAKILQISEDYRMLIMQKAEKIKHISEVWEYFNVKSNRELYNVGEIRYISSEYNLLMADLYRPVNWGRINARPVIIDFGFTRRVRKKYY
ncbi:hypothetical protein [[Clostridium] fimetarium]|uniref:Serine/threonine protein kinase n=1 Tax=[Clostridium] fimetarium TaxID=99656 RepID=A0A1I0RWB1_9FIRM|nr:hypothetical protein [[Clostridium] fimetarium]SEW45772.1 hypothetical protein SAMN05421659_1273 [[Clostridium] fimetarium]